MFIFNFEISTRYIDLIKSKFSEIENDEEAIIDKSAVILSIMIFKAIIL